MVLTKLHAAGKSGPVEIKEIMMEIENCKGRFGLLCVYLNSYCSNIRKVAFEVGLRLIFTAIYFFFPINANPRLLWAATQVGCADRAAFNLANAASRSLC